MVSNIALFVKSHSKKLYAFFNIMYLFPKKWMKKIIKILNLYKDLRALIM